MSEISQDVKETAAKVVASIVSTFGASDLHNYQTAQRRISELPERNQALWTLFLETAVIRNKGSVRSTEILGVLIDVVDFLIALKEHES